MDILVMPYVVQYTYYHKKYSYRIKQLHHTVKLYPVIAQGN